VPVWVLGRTHNLVALLVPKVFPELHFGTHRSLLFSLTHLGLEQANLSMSASDVACL
jgi:hypothetical protein